MLSVILSLKNTDALDWLVWPPLAACEWRNQIPQTHKWKQVWPETNKLLPIQVQFKMNFYYSNKKYKGVYNFYML